MMDYFGNLRSPLWDEMEEIQEENQEIANMMPRYEDKIRELTEQVDEARRHNRILAAFKKADTENTVSYI